MDGDATHHPCQIGRVVSSGASFGTGFRDLPKHPGLRGCPKAEKHRASSRVCEDVNRRLTVPWT